MEAVQDRLICEEETAEAESAVGVEGAVVSAGATAVFRTIPALWPLREIELTSGSEVSGDSRLSCVSWRPPCGRATDATLPVGLTYT